MLAALPLARGWCAPLAASSACVPNWLEIGAGEQFAGSVLAATRGEDGFVYLGGSEALYRVEGETLRKWFVDPTQEGGLRSGQIRGLAPGEGGLWIGAGAGLIWFDFASERFDAVPEGGEEAVTAVLVHDGVVYVGNRDGGARLDASTRQLLSPIVVPGDEQVPAIVAFAVFEGEVVAASHAGLLRIDDDGNAALALGSQAPLRVYDLATSPEQGLWFAYGKGIGSLGTLDGAPEYFDASAAPGLPDGRIANVTLDRSGGLWIGSDRGISYWAADQAEPSRCRKRPSAGYDRALNVALLEGGLGDFLLVGPWGGGAMFMQINDRISRIISGERWNPGLPKTVIWSQHRYRDGRLVLGTSNGLYRQLAPGAAEFEPLAPEQIGAGVVLALAEDARGNLWVGSTVGLFVMPNEDDIVAVPLFVTPDDSADYVYDIVPYGERMLVGTSQGLLVFAPNSETATVLFRTDPVGVEVVGGAAQVDLELAYPRIWQIHVDGPNVYGTSDTAVVRVDPVRGTVEASTKAARQRGEFNVGRAYAATTARDGRVFVATEAGLLVGDADLEKFTSVVQVNGFRLGSVYAAARGPDGVLWFGTANAGVWRYRPSTDEWRRLGQRDGLLSRNMTQKALRVLADGQILKAGGEGMTIVDPGVWDAPVAQELMLVASATDRGLTLNDGERLEIGPVDRELTLSLSTAAPLEADALQVEYQLVPGGSSQRIGLRDRVSLAQLRPGDYVFRAALVDPSGEVSAPFAFDLTVLPRWWETRWSKGLAVVACLLGAVAVIAWRTQIIREKANLLAAERRRIAASLHDTYLQDMLGALMVSRTIPMAQELSQAKEHGERISELLENASKSARSSVKALADLRDFPGLVDSLREHEAVDTFQQRKSFVLEESGQPWSLGKEREFFLSRAAREAVTNACKHARASSIVCSIRWRLLGLTVQVADDGRGFDPCADALDSGFGLGGMRSLAHAARARARIDSRPAKGTTVTFHAARFALR